MWEIMRSKEKQSELYRKKKIKEKRIAAGKN